MKSSNKLVYTVLFLSLLLPCTAAVKRLPALESPRAASVLKFKSMTLVETGPPVVPMSVQLVAYPPDPQTLYIFAEQVANTRMTFEYATAITGPWLFMGEWTPYPVTQWVGLGWADPQQPTLFVRAIQGSSEAVVVAAKLTTARTAPAGVVKLPSSKTKPNFSTLESSTLRGE
jgi:hypothetical protein